MIHLAMWVASFLFLVWIGLNVLRLLGALISYYRRIILIIVLALIPISLMVSGDHDKSNAKSKLEKCDYDHYDYFHERYFNCTHSKD